MTEPTLDAMFGFGIKLFRKPDGHFFFQTQTKNEGVPMEIVIMQVRAFLNEAEKEYFGTSNRL